MTEKEKTQASKNNSPWSNGLFFVGIALMAFGIVIANAAILAIGIVFFVIGLAQRGRNGKEHSSPSAEPQINQDQIYKLYKDNTDTLLTQISGEQLQFLIDNLEEEFPEDHDYAISSLTLDYLLEQGADPDLINLLREALGEGEEMTIIWKPA